jgi:protease IV
MKTEWTESAWKWLANAFRTLRPYAAWCVVGAVAVFVGVSAVMLLPGADGDLSSELASLDGCNVLGITVHGCIITYAPVADDGTTTVPYGCDAMTVSEDVMLTLQEVSKDKNIRAVLFDIDSTGGQPQAALEIERSLKASGKPSVAWIRAYGDSAAYWLASGADTIFASRESQVGSIGVTQSYVDNAKQNASEGLTYNSISTGKFKDLGDPDKSLTTEERSMLEKSNRISLEHFIETISVNRKIPIEKVRALADGSSWLGEEARSLGLVDQIGTYPEVLSHLEEIIKEEPVICWQ